MHTTKMTSEAVLAAASVISDASPIVMLNLLRYRERADYGDRTDAAPCSGRDAYYGRYLPAFNQVAAAEGVAGISIVYAGAVLAHVVAPADEQWDDVAIVHYPDFATFRRITESPHYAADAAPHRHAALADWRLIATMPVSVPT